MHHRRTTTRASRDLKTRLGAKIALIAMMSSIVTVAGAPPASAAIARKLMWGSSFLAFPSGVATDSSGNSYVVDSANHRIRKFGSDGAVIGGWGANGTSDGQFSSPGSITIDSSGNVYVSDLSRIQKFDANGAFITKWGSQGSGDGQFSFFSNYPGGVATDSAGNVYVADTLNHRVQKFSSTGTFLRKWGSSGSADGQFASPQGIAVDSSNNVYVADTQNNRIQKFDPDGSFLAKWGTGGQSNGQLSRPRSITIDSAGNLYVADTGNNRIQKFDPTGGFIASWGSFFGGGGTVAMKDPGGVAIDPSGNVLVADTGQHRIQKFSATGTFLAVWSAGNGQFAYPQGVATDPSGNIYVLDTGNSRVQKFDSNGTFMTGWGSVGQGSGQFDRPQAITTDLAGNVYVADFLSRIQKFDSNGNFVMSWGTTGSGDGQLRTPKGITVDAAGNVYVVEEGNSRVTKFGPSGNYLAKWGSLGTGDGQFRFASNVQAGIEVDSLGNVYVADFLNDRVQKFTSNGSFLTKWGSSGSGPGQFHGPVDLDTDSDGNVHVLDRLTTRVQEFNQNGAFLTEWGPVGPPENQLRFPSALTIDPSDDFIIADTTNHRIQKFAETHSLTVSKVGSGSGTVTSDIAGVDCGPDCTHIYDHGTSVTLTANPDASSTFTGWTGACSGTGTCTVSMTEPRSVTATFTLKSYSLEVVKSGNGTGSVMSNIAGIDCGADCSETYTHGTIVTLTATPSIDSNFSGWSGACSGTESCQVTMDQARNVTAEFSLKTFSLDVAKSGTGSGSVSSDIAGIDCGSDCSETYDHGTQVSLTAAPDVGSTFTGWSGACSGPDACVVTMDQARSVTAEFTINSYALDVAKSGTGTGSVSSDIAGIDCGSDCSETYDHGTQVSLTAAPDVSSTFTGWSGECSGTDACVVTMDQARGVTAEFTLKAYDLTVTKTGTGTGTAASDLPGVDCGLDCVGTYDHGAIVNLTATPASNSIFVGWGGACTGKTTCQVTMDQARDVTASFKGKSTITMGLRKKATRVNVSGRVLPVHPGKKVVLTLFKKKSGRFVKVAGKKATLNTSSRYASFFNRQSRGTCRIRASFSDLDHVPSKVIKTFSC